MTGLRRLATAVSLLIAASAIAAPMAYEPLGLDWTAEEVERLAAAQGAALTERAARDRLLGCHRHCERLTRVFGRLVAETRHQNARGARLNWTLTVVNLPEVDAQVLSGGRVVISEHFVEHRTATDEALAFVLAHEMAHDILEHERQSLSFARLLLPRLPRRSVRDVYTEMDFNFSLRRAMAPVMQQGEFEADELGLMMASAAGYSPDRQLAFLEQECRADAGAVSMVETHPAACARLRALQTLLPLARLQ